MTKIRMIRLPKRWSSEYYSSESFGKNNWNNWNIGDVGYIVNTSKTDPLPPAQCDPL